jgi:HlyD family secretion protein
MTTVETPSIARQRNRPLAHLIEQENKRRGRRQLLWWALSVFITLLAVGAWFALRPRPLALAVRFRMQPVSQGDLMREVRASGNLEAVTTVQVGAQTSGRIATVEVDYNDRVKAGQVLARFDLTPLQAQLAQAQANLDAAQWSLAQAKTDSEKSQRDLQRAEALWQGKILADADHDTAVNTASLAQQRVTTVEAQLAAQQAVYKVAGTNLDYAVIKAPIDGIIVTRNIDPGQTLASAFQTPVLFSLAADLRKMRVVVPVDEADVGEVADGQKATFAVDTYPDRVFQGVVTRVRNSPVTVQDVVTYGTEVEVKNPDLALKPGMTASVRIRTASATNALRVPNAALRFTPPKQKNGDKAGVWVLEGGVLRRVSVRPGISDGEVTEIAPGALTVGSNVLVELTPEGKKAYGIGP